MSSKQSSKLSRRKFLQASAAAAGGLLIGGTSAAQAAQNGPFSGGPLLREAMKYKEAPMLAELVKAGKLPPVEERLPANPLVVKPVESVGKYGGVWRRGWRGINDYHTFGRTVYEPMLRWPRDPKGAIEPGLAGKWRWGKDSKKI